MVNESNPFKDYTNYLAEILQEKPRTEAEMGDEALVMAYLDILKYAKYHCPDDEDPFEITDRIFIDMLKANGENNEN